MEGVSIRWSEGPCPYPNCKKPTLGENCYESFPTSNNTNTRVSEPSLLIKIKITKETEQKDYTKVGERVTERVSEKYICNSGENHPIAYRLAGITQLMPWQLGKTHVLRQKTEDAIKIRVMAIKVIK